jgi:hypothetical protein
MTQLGNSGKYSEIGDFITEVKQLEFNICPMSNAREGII